MHLLLLVLRLLLNLLSGSGQNGLSMAARSDGRVEQLPADRALRDAWGSRQRAAAARRAKVALAVRAGGEVRASGEASTRAAAPPG
jgi:hypothetical protein